MLRTRATNWITRMVSLRGGSIDVLVMPCQGDMVCLPAYPSVARTPQHTPIFSLTLIVNDLPQAGKTDASPLIAQSLLTLGLTLKLPDDVLLTLNEDSRHRPLYIQHALFALVYRQPNGQELILAAQPTAGIQARVTLSLLCGRDETLALLKALEHEPNALSIRVYITYQHIPGTRTIALSGNWRAIRSVVAQVMQPERTGFISREELQCCFNAMQDTGIINTTCEGDTPIDDDVLQDEIFALFARNIAPILKPTKSVDEDGRVMDGFVLKRQYLDETMSLACRQVITAPEEQLLEMNAPLEKVLGGVLKDLNRAQLITVMHYLTGNLVPLPPGLRSHSGEYCGAGC